MASGLQIKCTAQILQGGYINPDGSQEEHGFSRGYGDWANVGLSGSVESNYYYRDSNTADDANSTRVVITIRDSWETDLDDATNTLTVRLTSTIVSIDRTAKQGSPASGYNRDLMARPDWNGDWTWSVWNDDPTYEHHIADNINLGTRTFTLSPGASSGRGTVYFRNHTAGMDESEQYRDEFWFGIDVRNTLPDKPSAPTFGAVTQVAASCTTVNARMVITPTASSGIYPGITHHARYYVNGAWSEWTSRFPLVMSDLPANTQITVQAYSNQGNLVGPTASTTFTTWKRPEPATVALARQYGSADETRVDLTFSYSQSDYANYNNVTVYGKVKNGDDDWSSDWFALGTSQTGEYKLTSVDQDRVIGFKTYTVGDGLCSDERSYTFKAFAQPDPVVYNTPGLVDTGACYNVSIPWTQPSYANYTSGKTYISYRVNNSRWSHWTEAANWVAGTLVIDCVPYDAEIEVRAYSIGDGLRSSVSTYSLTIPPEVIDDTPYDGELFMNDVLCENLMYLVELICQEWYAIRKGERTVYTNEDTKKACKGDEFDPTLHSILSRIYRYFQALNCLICSGLNDSFNHHKRGPEDTVYRSEGDGEYGHWTLPDTVVTENSDNLVYSYAVRNAIDEFVHSVYHYVGDYQYMVYKPTQLDDLLNVENGDKAIVKIGADGTNQIYTYDGSSWSAGDSADFDAFSLVHIDKPSNFVTDYGLSVEIKAGSAWYWYNSNWNNLDAQIDDLIADLDELLNRNYVNKRDASETSIYVTTVQRNTDGSVTGLPISANKTVYFVTEDI